MKDERTIYIVKDVVTDQFGAPVGYLNDAAAIRDFNKIDESVRKDLKLFALCKICDLLEFAREIKEVPHE